MDRKAVSEEEADACFEDEPFDSGIAPRAATDMTVYQTKGKNASDKGEV